MLAATQRFRRPTPTSNASLWNMTAARGGKQGVGCCSYATLLELPHKTTTVSPSRPLGLFAMRYSDTLIYVPTSYSAA